MAENKQSTKKIQTAGNVLCQLEDEEDTDFASADIFISPPGDGQNSNEDDVNDHVQEVVSANFLPGRQLRMTTQIKQDSDDPDQTSSSEEDEAGPPTRPRKRISRSRVWRKEDIRPRENEWVENQPELLQEDTTPTKCFERFFDDIVIGHIVTETLCYAKRKGDHSFTIDPIEMRAFLAILFISGYNDACIGNNKMMLSILPSVVL
ncbi:hypothetical protein RRG08_016826 [Elysia crispata]|uniref:PiggyBac transposable element-derived protein domain-containing protein n=1 Tax=Elysia crispata TaxID=231223 RepID=A0AAE0Z8L9_9GAST|nr:hypothetical protein RRG08_016826 [Elysia crispata]